MASRSRAIDAKDLASQGRLLLQGGINARGLTQEVGIIGAEHDSSMVRMGEVEALEVFPIEGDEHPAFGRGERQDQLIRDGLPSSSCVLKGKNVVPGPP